MIQTSSSRATRTVGKEEKDNRAPPPPERRAAKKASNPCAHDLQQKGSLAADDGLGSSVTPVRRHAAPPGRAMKKVGPPRFRARASGWCGSAPPRVAPSGNRTRVTSMATRYYTTKPTALKRLIDRHVRLIDETWRGSRLPTPAGGNHRSVSSGEMDPREFYLGVVID